MRVFGQPRSQGPSWIVAVFIFVALMAVVQLSRDSAPQGHPLEQHFAATPRPAGGGGLALPPLPTGIAGLARTIIARITGGSVGAALTPVAEGDELRIEIEGISEVAGGLRITGEIANIGTRPLPISLAAFRFTDGSGKVYAAQGDSSTMLAPGQRAPLDLTLPVKDLTQLTLEVQLEGGTPLRMILIQSPDR